MNQEQSLDEEFKNFTQKQIEDFFINACKKGDLNKIKSVSASQDVNKKFSWFQKLLNSFKDELSDRNIEGFKCACENGHLEIVKYLLNSNNFKDNAFFLKLDKESLQSGFTLACESNRLEIVKYFLNSPNLKGHIDINRGFKWACQNGHIDVVKYLLTSPELTEHANIHENKDECFRKACDNGQLEIIKYLLVSSDLKEHADIHANNDEGFIFICQYGYLDVAKYLIFDMNIEKTKAIQVHLEENPNEQVENMFKIRDLNKQLEKDLNSDKFNQKKPKL